MTIIEVILIAAVAALGSGGLVSWLHLRTTRDKDVSETDKNKAETQAIIIANLQSENKRMFNEVEALRIEVAELRGHLAAMERLKVQEIAHETAKKVVAELVGDPDVGLDNGD